MPDYTIVAGVPAQSHRPSEGRAGREPVRRSVGLTQEQNMIGIAVVGYGYWGPNLVRNFWEAPGARLVSVCDLRTERLAGVQSRYPAVEITSRLRRPAERPARRRGRDRDAGVEPLRAGAAGAAGRQARLRREADDGDGRAGASG